MANDLPEPRRGQLPSYHDALNHKASPTCPAGGNGAEARSSGNYYHRNLQAPIPAVVQRFCLAEQAPSGNAERRGKSVATPAEQAQKLPVKKSSIAVVAASASPAVVTAPGQASAPPSPGSNFSAAAVAAAGNPAEANGVSAVEIREASAKLGGGIEAGAVVSGVAKRAQVALEEMAADPDRDWAFRILQAQLKLPQQSRVELHKRSEKLRQMYRARAQVVSISERSDTVTREVRNQIENFSLIKGRPEGSQKWDEFAEVASSKIKDSYQRGNVEDEVKRGRARISRVKKVSLSGAAQEAQDRRELREIGMAMAEFKAEPASPEEGTSKFKVYEAWAAAALTIRDDLYAFVASTANQQALGSAVIEKMMATLLSIDQPANLIASPHTPGTWFVYSMAIKVCSNMQGMRKVMRSFEQLLMAGGGAEDRCPVCIKTVNKSWPWALDVLDECCHATCRDCLDHCLRLSRATGVHLCPVCRQREFLAVLSSKVGI